MRKTVLFLVMVVIMGFCLATAGCDGGLGGSGGSAKVEVWNPTDVNVNPPATPTPTPTEEPEGDG